MRFSNFLFPESRDPTRDGAALDEVMAEVRLTEQLGFDTLWLSEHHFDGNCAYVDPVAFAAAVAVTTQRVRIGFAVAQLSLHHPIRLAEQLSLIDHLSKGRLIVGLGRGTAYNIYEYHGYGIDPAEAQARYEEATGIILQAWTSENGFTHKGRFWDLKVPALRPRPFTRPHPVCIHGASGEASLIELGRLGEPFLMNVQSMETTTARIAAWRAAGQDAGASDEQMAAALDQSWVWRNVFVADTDAEAERIALPAFAAMQSHRAAMRNRVMAEQGLSLAPPSTNSPLAPTARIDPRHAMICGSPATVAARMAELEATGIGGVILAFRMGPLSWEHTARSLTLFAEQVVPRTRMQQAA
jgi:alkanesulfonate monooxygenase SsuD/methylene tetrahydromethanopterin reductase-like flavin-dependent oxidoreductase (luciferase family)